MVDCIVLDDDDDVVMAESQPAAKKQIQKKPLLTFEKRLITLVRKHSIIYDNKHKLFANGAKKDLIWQKIADKLKVNVDICKTTWFEMRHKYQCHVRQLRKYFLYPQKRKPKKLKRPIMDYEDELTFLYRFIENSTYCAIPYEIIEPPYEEDIEEVPANIDDDLILIEPAVDMIVIDDDEDNKSFEKVFRVTSALKALVANVKKYPELYDTTLPQYMDYSRKSHIWNTIANNMRDKATKLMKSWIVMETRFEWEISRNVQNVNVTRSQTELQKVMEYFEPYIMANSHTVYKNAYYLKQGWHEPIVHLHDIQNLMSRLKRAPEIISVSDALLRQSDKTEEYLNLWADVAKLRNYTVGQCETTWLIMRHFYWELMKMRKQNYQLTDKWRFEVIITELYDLVKQQQMQPNRARENQNTAMSSGSQNTVNNIPMVTVPGPLPIQPQPQKFKTAVVPSKTQQVTQAAARTQIQIPATVTQTPAPLPIISSAISLAPQNMTLGVGNACSTVGGSLQLLSAVNQQNAVVQPKAQTSLIINNTLSPANINLPQIQASNPTISVQQQPIPCNPQAQAPLDVPAALPNTSALSNVPTTLKRPRLPIVGRPNVNNSKETEIADKKPVLEENNTQNSAALQKTNGAASLLNSNEILIELIESQNGIHLVVHGPPLSENYNLPRATMAKFIREILAIPLMHNKKHNQSSLINSYWDYISKKFNLPSHICNACWNFLVANFAHFPQIAPLKELMKPFSTDLKVWTESSDLFNVFDQHAVSNGWLNYMTVLPDVVGFIGSYPVLYKDVGKTATDMETLCAWRTIGLSFPKIKDISTIWTAFKNVFFQYMSAIEFGIDNKWPINWWRVLAKMKFLVESRYNSKEPFYYIVSNKMMEEIERCARIEMKKRYCSDETPVVAADTQTATNLIPNNDVTECQINDVELIALLTAIEKHPIIYEKGDCMQKLEAWNKVAIELHMEVKDCLQAFHRACHKYCLFKRQDSLSLCTLNQKYYKRLDAIFRSVKPAARSKLNIRTPFELNKSFDDRGTSGSTTSAATEPASNCNISDEVVFPERYISDITMSNCDSNLVVKNWIYAIGNVPIGYNDLNFKLRKILRKYLAPSKAKM